MQAFTQAGSTQCMHCFLTYAYSSPLRWSWMIDLLYSFSPSGAS
jgi:hypothetical protein